KLVTRTLEELPGAPPVYLAEMQVAYVRDTAVLGPISPIVGHRIRLDVEPAVGGLTFADVRLDARRYFMPIRPITFAVRLDHTGRYGPDARDDRDNLLDGRSAVRQSLRADESGTPGTAPRATDG